MISSNLNRIADIGLDYLSWMEIDIGLDYLRWMEIDIGLDYLSWREIDIKLIINTLFRNCKFQTEIYLINHVSTEDVKIQSISWFCSHLLNVH